MNSTRRLPSMHCEFSKHSFFFLSHANHPALPAAHAHTRFCSFNRDMWFTLRIRMYANGHKCKFITVNISALFLRADIPGRRRVRVNTWRGLQGWSRRLVAVSGVRAGSMLAMPSTPRVRRESQPRLSSSSRIWRFLSMHKKHVSVFLCCCTWRYFILHVFWIWGTLMTIWLLLWMKIPLRYHWGWRDA